jgi:hypothetical protein
MRLQCLRIAGRGGMIGPIVRHGAVLCRVDAELAGPDL